MTKDKSETIYQFKIKLRDTPLPIWRRIQVPSTYSFWDLHVAIQDAMGWLDCHLHEFIITNPKTGEKERIGVPGDDEFMMEIKNQPGWELKLSDYFIDDTQNKKIKAMYLYDFGDSWEHAIEFEGEHEKKSGKTYPICLTGKGACPPEDVGGIFGYNSFVKLMNDPKHEDYETMLKWAGTSVDEPFDPNKFDPKNVLFDDPQERWNIDFMEE